MGEPCPPLDAKVVADVCIVGGGFAGLWTAIELSAREPGLRIALLEQDICGGGASGRNGGFFSSSWWDLPGLMGLFGEAEGLRYATAVSDEVEAAERWCFDHEVDAWFHREGALGIRAGAWQEGIAGEGPADVCARMGEPGRMRRLTVEEARAMADSPRITAATFVADSAICQPARLARGLRRVALERGVRIFERTAVRGIDRGRPAVVRAEHGAVRADQVVLTIGSWAASWPGFRRSFGVDRRLHGGDRADPGAATRDRVDLERGHRGRARPPVLPAAHRRRPDRDRRRRDGRRVRRARGVARRHPRPPRLRRGRARARVAVPPARGRALHARAGAARST